MELLEIALKQSIAWSLSEHNELPFGKAAAQKSSGKIANMPKELLESVESTNSEVQRESQVRAFVSRFMIELNQLMDRLQVGQNPETSSERTDGEASRATNTRNPNGEQQQQHYQKRSAEPTIEMKGKYSGVYNINGTQTTDEDEDFDEAYLRHLQLVYGALAEDQNSRQSSFRSSNSRRRFRHLAEGQQQIDDGYRSLSRDGSTTNATRRLCKKSERSVDLLKQLNDIKSRVVDLVRQLDDTAAPKLEEEELAAYRRRRDALVQKLDALIGRGTKEHSWDEERGDNSLQMTSADSSQSSSSDGYEEQTQVIDYDFKRRASDLAEIRRQGGSLRLRKAADLCASKSLVGPDVQTTTPLIDSARDASTHIDLSCVGSSKRPGKLFADCPAESIDFNAMMCDYERRKKAEDGKSSEDSLHLPSSSSTSSGSNTSTTASSYI